LIRKGAKGRWDMVIAHGQLLVVEVIQFHGLLSSTQVRGTPGALQRLGNLLLPMLAMGGAQLGQGEGIAFASDDGMENGQPRDTRQGTYDLGECAIHLL
jgi:hypothetical protein